MDKYLNAMPHYALVIDQPGESRWFTGFNSVGRVMVARDIVMADAVPANKLTETMNQIKMVLHPCEVRYSEFELRPYLNKKQLELLNLLDGW